MQSPSPFYSEQHEAFRATVRRFVAAEIEPYAAAWDEAETFPRELYQKAAAIGLLQMGFPAAYGGIDADVFYRIIAAQELARAGAGGISLLVIPRDAPGFTRTPLKKMGWWSSDTATLYFENCKVPADHLLGEENQGFALIMRNFNSERLGMAAGATAFARVCLDEAVAYARERKTFGRALIEHQVIRHKLVDMAMRVNAAQAWLETLAWRIEQGESPVAEICMLKNLATEAMEFSAREAVQIFGGAGFMRGPKVERIYREVRVNAIGGGSEEILRDLAARQMGW